MAENKAMFCSFTGAPAEQAAIFLEMAGGDVETAVSIFFSQQEGPMEVEPFDMDMAAATDPTAVAAAGVSGVGAPSWWGLVWPAREAPPEAWTAQCLDSGSGWPGGIPQPKNGPCGVLAVVHGLMLSAGQHSRAPAEVQVTPEATAHAILSILARCRPDDSSPIRLVRPKQHGQYGPEAELEESEFADMAAAGAEVRSRVEQFRGPGGIINLMYSAIFTRGTERVQAEALSEGGELPLVTKAFNCWLCTTELMSLLLRGNARGNVGAFASDGTRNSSWDGVPIGLLSNGEQSTGIPIADALKSPPSPVWILHGGDHFTVAWASAVPPSETGAKFTLHHWNGLPPGGPRLAELTVTATCGTATGAKEVPKFYKPEPGEVDDVVQADPDDKKAHPDQYRLWRYEVLLAWDDPNVQGEPRPPDVAPEPKFEQEDPRFQRPGPWRCRLCYAKRFQTMDFNLVPADSPDACPKCEKPRKECGWSLWMPFADLPQKHQGTVMDRHAKKIEPILWTKWPAAEILAAEGPLPDC